MNFLKSIKKLVKRLTNQHTPSRVIEPISKNLIFMETLETTLCHSHDWAVDRINFLSGKQNFKDAESIHQEFCEWFDSDISEHNIISMNYLEDIDI